jgi:hypothetical protein
MKSPLLASCFVACLGLAAAPSASAVALMLDFGPTAITTGSFTNSPYHAVSGVTDGTWKSSIVGDVNSGLFYSDNSPATNVAVNMGVSYASTVIGQTATTINLGLNTFNTTALTGSATNTGVYADTSAGRDGIFTSNNNNPYIGLQVTGLSAGTYDIYIVARNTNTGADQAAYTQTAYAGKSASVGNFDFSAYSATSESLLYPSGPTNTYSSNWVEGSNYVKLSITLTSGEYLNLAVAGGGTGAAARGFLNSVQIVSTSTVPEPSTYAVLGGLVALGLAIHRRRRA